MHHSLVWFFSSKGHVALDRNREPGYNTLLLRLIPDLLSACAHTVPHTTLGSELTIYLVRGGHANQANLTRFFI